MLVLLDDDLGLALLHRDLDDFLVEEAAILRALAAALAAISKGVLVGAADLVLGRDVFGGLAHRINAVRRFHLRIHEAPAQYRVLELHAAIERAFGLAHHIGRARHALDAARDHNVGFTELHCARGVPRSLETRAAEAVYRGTRDLDRQTGQKPRHARYVAIVLSRLIDAAVDDVVDGAPVDIGVALHQRLQRMGGKIVDPHRAQAAVVAADGGTNRIADESFGYVVGHLGELPELSFPPG